MSASAPEASGEVPNRLPGTGTVPSAAGAVEVAMLGTASGPDATSAEHRPDRRPGRPPGRPRGWHRWCAAALGAVTAWATTLWVASHLSATVAVHDAALFAHLTALTVGFGAVLATDYQAAMWLLRRRELTDIVRFGTQVHSLIWLGLGGLLVSGMLLGPNLAAPLTRVKMALVLIVALNGLAALALQHRLDSSRRLPRRLLAAAAAIGLISQLSWWGTVGIGFTTSMNGRLQRAAVQPAGPARPPDRTNGPAPATPPTPLHTPLTSRPANPPPHSPANPSSHSPAMNGAAAGEADLEITADEQEHHNGHHRGRH